MQRDFILVVGNQNCGKSVWAKIFARSLSRLLVFDPMASYARVNFSTPENWLEDVAHNRLNGFRYGSSFPDDLETIASAAFGAGNCMLLLEECALIFRRGEELHEWAKPLIFMGRHQRVSLLFVAQRASKIPIDVRSQASRIISFRQTEPNDVSAITERIGESCYDEIIALPDLHCIDWNGGIVNRYPVRAGPGRTD
jgi:hypothetical protein